MANIDDVLKSIETMPPFPGAAFKALSLIRKGDYSIMDMVNVIRLDPSITANVLKMCRSPYFGASHEITSIHDAVTIVGQENLVRIIQTAGVSGFYKQPSKGYLFSPRGLWKHCVAVAIMSQSLIRKIYRKEDPVLYTAALLHDVGKIILGEFVYESFEKITDLVSKAKYTFCAAEREVIGINHAELGGKIAEYWNFPDELRDAITHHHNPQSPEEDDVRTGRIENFTATLVHISDQACLMTGLTGGSDTFVRTDLINALKPFNLSLQDIEALVPMLQRDLKRAQSLINVVP